VDEMFAALRTLAASGTSMLLVEQYVARALSMADAVILLKKGAVTYTGPPSDSTEVRSDGYLGVE